MKLIVWDLDETIWNGKYVYDGENIVIKPKIKHILSELDNRGFLQSISSRNPSDVLDLVEKLEIRKYFILPQISWQTKDIMIGKLITITNILPKDIAFIDDDPFNLDIVKTKFNDILCINACDYDKILKMNVFNRSKQKRDKKRKEFYIDESKRLEIKEKSKTSNNFINNLDLFLELKTANDKEIISVIELLNRANQLHATGRKYENTNLFKEKYKTHNIIIGYPEDKYGSYGLTLVAICKTTKTEIFVDELIVSCRVLDRKLLPCFLRTIQNKLNRDIMFVKFISTKYNDVLEIELKKCGFSKTTNYLKIYKKIEIKTKVRIKDGIQNT